MYFIYVYVWKRNLRIIYKLKQTFWRFIMGLGFNLFTEFYTFFFFSVFELHFFSAAPIAFRFLSSARGMKNDKL